jgi:hypothetical protein
VTLYANFSGGAGGLDGPTYLSAFVLDGA